MKVFDDGGVFRTSFFEKQKSSGVDIATVKSPQMMYLLYLAKEMVR